MHLIMHNIVKIIIEHYMNSRQIMGSIRRGREMGVNDIYNMHVQTSQIKFKK